MDQHDLPVSSRYLSQASGTGAALHRTSRWLNAASFDATAAQIEANRAQVEAFVRGLLQGQERLQAARVLVVGLGGLGNPAALYLAAVVGFQLFHHLVRQGREVRWLAGTQMTGTSSLARTGAVVFSYDMVGWGESTQFEDYSFAGSHKKCPIGVGLHTWNSIRRMVSSDL